MKDYLNRENDRNLVLKIINSANENISFAINGKWGSGKTYFLKMLTEKLDSNYYIFYYDSWDNDYYEDPLIGMLEQLKNKIKEINKGKEAISSVRKHIFKKLIKAITTFIDCVIEQRIGLSISNTYNKIINSIKETNEDLEISNNYDEYDKLRLAKHLIVCALNELSKEKPIILMIDELDRCSPEYALKIMERTHHVSEKINKCITIFSVDISQLKKIITTSYGYNETDIEIDAYFKKIIDFTYYLDNGNINNQFKESLYDYETRFNNTTAWISEESISNFISILFNNLEIRNTKNVINLATKIHDLIKNDSAYPRDLMCFELFITWSALTYGNKYIETISKMFLSKKQTDSNIINYLIQIEDSLDVMNYDEIFERKYLNVSNLETLLIYYFLHKYDETYCLRKVIPFNITPQYLNGFLEDFEILLSKINYRGK